MKKLLVVVALLSLISLGGSDLAADRAECTDQLIGLAPCLPFVGGEAKSPTPDCCTGYLQVTAKSIKCVCILIKDRDDPNLGLKIDVDSAVNLPAKCNKPINVSSCTGILKLPSNSKEAKDFDRLERKIEGKASQNGVQANSTGAGATGAAKGKDSNDAKRAEMFGGVWTWSLVLIALVVGNQILWI